MDACAPIATKEILRPPAPWISDDIKNSMKVRDRLQRDLKLNRFNTTLRETYLEQKKRVRFFIDNGRREYYREEFSNNKHDISASWRIAKKNALYCQ